MTTENTTALTVVQRAVAALGYNAETVKSLTELAEGSKHIVAITNDDSYKQIHGARMQLKTTRVEIEKRGKTAREDATAFSKAVIAEEKRLIGLIEPEEKRLGTIQQAHDDRIEAEKQAKIRAEQERVAGIQSRIAEFRGCVEMVLRHSPMPATQIAEHIEDLKKIAVDDSFAEFRGNAEIEMADTLKRLGELHTAAVNREAEDARLAAERAEIDRQRAEQEKRNRVERERIAAEEAASRKIREAAEAEAAENLRKEREAFEAEQAAARERQAAEDRRIAAERAELERRQREEREAAEAKARAEQEAEEARERARLEEHVRMEREAAARAKALRKALTKVETIAGPSCLTKAADDELVFVLRAKDPAAPAAIRAWAEAAKGVHESDKVSRALDEAVEFEQWRAARFPAKEAA